MLVLRKGQMDAFQESGERRFEDRTIAHLTTHFPKNCQLLGAEQVRNFVKYAVGRGKADGFSSERELTLYANLTMLLGGGFSRDPQLSEITAALHYKALIVDSGRRIGEVYDLTMRYIDRIAGPDNAYWARVLRYLKGARMEDLLNPAREDFVESTLVLLARIYPEKYTAVGRNALIRLIDLGLEHCRKTGFQQPDAQAFYIGLMYLLGSGFWKDPQFPWAASILDNAKAGSETEVFRELYDRSMAYLDEWTI